MPHTPGRQGCARLVLVGVWLLLATSAGCGHPNAKGRPPATATAAVDSLPPMQVAYIRAGNLWVSELAGV
jgi:hypothetical protein